MKYLFLGALILLVTNCSSTKYSDSFIYGEKLFTNFINSYLKGDDVAEVFFLKSVDTFQRSDDFCNLSRIYLTKFLLNEEEHDEKSFTQGKLYAENGECIKETNLFEFYGGGKFDENLFDSYYESYLKILNKNDIQELLKENDNFPDYFHSRVLRSFAKSGYTDKKTKIKLIEKALEIDRFNGWTLNLLRDYSLLKEFYDSEEKISQITAKIELLREKLHKK